MKVHVEVTQDDIDMAAFEYGLNDGPRWLECCPIAQALNRQLPQHEWCVDPQESGGVWRDGFWGQGKAASLPLRARRFGRRWDRVYNVRDNWPMPFAFDIDLPVTA